MIALGNDHVGLNLKKAIIKFLDENNIRFIDYGCNTQDRVDYPIYAHKVADSVASGICEKGILICGTGVGMSIAANKIEGIRAVVCSDPYSASMSRRHNDSNVLALGARVIGPGLAKMILKEWINTEFEGDRHLKRLNMINDKTTNKRTVNEKYRQLLNRDAYLLGFDIGATKTNIGLFDHSGGLIDKCKIENNRNKTCRENIMRISDAAKKMLKRNSVSLNNISFAGAGLPGTIDKDNSKLLFAPNAFWTNEPVREYFHDFLGLEVKLVQDSRAAVLGEALCGSGKGYDNIVCITVGTGIGAGIIINRKIYSGGLFSAGEIGHMVVKPQGRRCNCGKRGCLEAYASGTAIAKEARKKMPNNPDPYLVFKEAKMGNRIAKDIIEEAIKYLSIGIVNIVNILSPQAVIISGGLCNQEELLIEPLREMIVQMGYGLCVKNKQFSLIRAGLGEDAPLYGAAMLYMGYED